MQNIIVALVLGAINIFKNKDGAFKENLKSITTVLATAPAAVATQSAMVSGLLPPDNLEAAIVQVVNGLLAIVLFFLHEKEVLKK